MADHFVDSTTGNNADSGHTMDLAWATLEYALESGSLVAGDIVWVRRVHSEIPASDIAPVYDGAADNPIRVIGWPRNTFSITSATWTNGSTTVDLVLPASMDREKDCGRYVTGPDGYDYLITRIIDTNTFIIDREYAGATVTGAGGAATIKADEDYSLAQAIDDTGWTITKADYNGDADDLPVIDFNDGSFQLIFSGDNYYETKNLEIKDSADAYGVLRIASCRSTSIVGCLLKQSLQSKPVFRAYDTFGFFKRCIFEGSGSGAAQRGIFIGRGLFHIKDCAVYNLGDQGIYNESSVVFLENVNIGVEVANGDDDIGLLFGGLIYGRDVKLGGTNGYFNGGAGNKSTLKIENYNKILGDHKAWWPGGTFEKAAVTGETPNKKVSDDIIKIVPSVSGFQFIEDWAVEIFTHEFEADATSKTYKYWLYNDAMGTLNSGDAKGDVWLKVEYIVSQDDTSEYVVTEKFSTEQDIANAADADDWDYLQVSAVQPAVASKVRITCYCRAYSATGKIYIDPAVVIS